MIDMMRRTLIDGKNYIFDEKEKCPFWDSEFGCNYKFLLLSLPFRQKCDFEKDCPLRERILEDD